MTGLVIGARVEVDQRHELMQMFKETSRPDQLPVACLGRRVYEEAHLPTNLLLVEQWSDGQGIDECLCSIGLVSGFDRRGQSIGKISGWSHLRGKIDSRPEGRAELKVVNDQRGMTIKLKQ